MNPHQDAALLLLTARTDPARRPASLPDAQRPRTAADAYAIQRAIMAQLGPIGGWKVGAAHPDATDFTCAPLPARAILDSPAESPGSEHGVEAEIAIRLAADLPARDAPYTEAEIQDAIGSVHPAIEVLASRYAAGAPDPLSGLADSLSHHSLVLGAPILDWTAIDLARETVRVTVEGREIKRGTGNPGGEMLRMLRWLADTGARWAGGLAAGQVITTGSWTGKDVLDPGREARIEFARCGHASVMLP